MFIASAGLVTTLNRVTLTVLTNEECRLTFGNQVLDTMVCVDGMYNQGTCNVSRTFKNLKQFTLCFI